MVNLGITVGIIFALITSTIQTDFDTFWMKLFRRTILLINIRLASLAEGDCLFFASRQEYKILGDYNFIKLFIDFALEIWCNRKKINENGEVYISSLCFDFTGMQLMAISKIHSNSVFPTWKPGIYSGGKQIRKRSFC